ncbi:hypothetical protein [Rhizobium rhizogenes]|uniref:hypothetical protein n=1 Tax=Rhizobium rhizogenes TaxID=359 RepID=UPI001A9C4DF4|nr:hypothetical protein [Rhizobium rhizogenes]
MSPATAARHTAFAFDLDGTSTRAELLPVKAPELGLEAEMRLLTSLTMAEKKFVQRFFHRQRSLWRAQC